MTTMFDTMTMTELKKLYRRAVKALHPDNGGDAELFKMMQAEYAEVRNFIKRKEEAAKEEAEKKAREEAEKKAAEKKAKKCRVSSANMDPRVFTLLSSIENVLDAKPHGRDGYVFTMPGQRKRVFEIYRVKNGYTLWMPENLADAIGLRNPSRVCGGTWSEFKFDTAEDVINTLLKLW